jgi:hypothetical protein
LAGALLLVCPLVLGLAWFVPVLGTALDPVLVLDSSLVPPWLQPQSAKATHNKNSNFLIAVSFLLLLFPAPFRAQLN